MLSDDELAYWGAWGRGTTMKSAPLGGSNWGEDLVALWNAFGALEAKVRAMSSDD